MNDESDTLFLRGWGRPPGRKLRGGTSVGVLTLPAQANSGAIYTVGDPKWHKVRLAKQRCTSCRYWDEYLGGCRQAKLAGECEG